MKKLNPYEPTNVATEDRTLLERLRRMVFAPTPSRIAPEQPMRWVVDAVIAFVLIIAGIAFAELLRDAFAYLGPLAYPTALLVSWFPTGLWIHYCNVGRDSIHSNATLILVLLVVFAASTGWAGLMLLPVSILTLLPILLIEWITGKIVLSALPGGHERPGVTRRTTEP
ncbi:hypothetical protein [Stieleria neptunia]|uniref:hypothetical protein n=1 Tax=Stieleria neptunia TaxID=2527979 RepID=UPI0011AA340C|nr:hypothetical protein [Stieleria neptunia]